MGTGIEPSLRRKETFGGGGTIDDGFVDTDEIDFDGGIVDDAGDLFIVAVDEEEEDDDDVVVVVGGGIGGACGSFGEILTWVLRSRNQARTLNRFGINEEGRWLLIDDDVAVFGGGRTVDEWVYLSRNGNGDNFSNWLVIRSNKSLSPCTSINAHDS